MLVYPSSMPVSNRALQVLADALRQHRTAMGSRWRRLPPGRQALLVLAHLRKGETYTALAGGFGVGTTTVFRYIREGIDVLAAVAPTLDQALDVARRKAFVILDGTLISIDRIGMASGYDRAFFSGKHKRHGMNVQVLADPARASGCGPLAPPLQAACGAVGAVSSQSAIGRLRGRPAGQPHGHERTARTPTRGPGQRGPLRRDRAARPRRPRHRRITRRRRRHQQ